MKECDESAAAAAADTVGAKSRCPALVVGVGRADAEGDSSRSQTPNASGILNAIATRRVRTAMVRVAGAVRIVTQTVSTRRRPFLTIVTQS